MFKWIGNNLKVVLAGLAVTLVLLTGVYISHLHGAIGQARVAALDANVRAANFEARYEEAIGATKELALQAGSAIHLTSQLRQRNAELAQHLEEAENTILVLEEAVVELRADLESRTDVEHEAGSERIVVTIDESVTFDGGGGVAVKGTVELRATPAPDEVRTESTDVGVSGSIPLTIVLSRNESGEIEVHASTGDSRLRVSAIDVTTNLDAAGNAERGFFSAIGAGIAKQVTGISPWINRGLGFLACTAIR